MQVVNEAVATEAVRLALVFDDRHLAERLSELFGGRGRPVVPAGRHLRNGFSALLAEDRSQYEAAAVGFAAAAAGWRDFGVPYEEAQALLGQGRCLLALGSAPEAAAPLGAAREIFARIGAQPALAETQQMLDSLTSDVG